MKTIFFQLLLLIISFNTVAQSSRSKEWNNYLVKVEKAKIEKEKNRKVDRKSNAVTIEDIAECDLPNVTPPKFPNCDSEKNLSHKECFTASVQKFIKSKFFFPDFAIDNKIQGKVVLEFEIDEAGKLEIISADGPQNGLILEEAVIQMFSKFPILTPAYQCGQPIRISHKIPITFIVD
ncbi:energy transducer TonB [Flavobacterium lacus]|uniref:TonB family protein n=1 Tax=Flavobacterium lacus TaxID=1353778 RepID=A0A328WU55_9FLAO|nr:energy transducer TonB [Flavobacterium lacus]RAR47384.1 TonB family protein [Flavobacterium lacus]